MKNRCAFRETENQARRLAATERINRQLALTASPDEALVLVAKAAADLLGAAAVGVRLREGCELVRAVALGKAPAIMVAERLSIATSLPGQVVRENRAVVSLDLLSALSEDPVHQKRVRAEGLGSWIGVPLPGPNQASGVLFAADAPERRFDRGDLEALQALASQAALAARLSRLQRDRTSQETRVSELAGQLLQSQERERRL
jgi:GAF domain-containing protein